MAVGDWGTARGGEGRGGEEGRTYTGIPLNKRAWEQISRLRGRALVGTVSAVLVLTSH